MATSKMFVHYSGTVDQFKALNTAEYDNKIVFIKGGADGKGAAIYTHGKYYANIAEVESLASTVSNLKIIKGISVNGGAAKTAADHNGIINFATDANATVTITETPYGIKIDASDDVKDAVAKKHSHTNKAELDKIVDGDKAKWDAAVVNLGSKSDAASSDASASAFARIASLTASVSALTGGSTGSVADQIDGLRKEINGTLGTGDATTLEAINDELDAIQANYIAKSDLATEASDNDGVNVKVTVKTKDGKVSDVIVDESALTAALNLKANAADVYDKTGAEDMAQGKVNVLANGAVKANADAILELKGNASLEGSIAKQIQDAINAFAGSADADNVIENVTELLNYVSGVDGSKTLANAIAQIEENKGKIATLNGDASTANSVAKTVADAKEEILGVITENERVTAEAYTNLDGRVIALEGKNATIDSALLEIVAVGSDYITLTDSDKTNNTQTINASIAVKAVSAATASKQGLADAYDVKQEIVAAKNYADNLFNWEEL